MHKWDDDIPLQYKQMAYHHQICAFEPKYDFSLIFMKICTWMHIKTLIMDIVNIMLFFTTSGGGDADFFVLATFINFY